MKYTVKNTTQFKRDLKIAVKRGYDIEKLKTVVKILAEGEALPKEYRDHELKGRYIGFRDCHIEPDWVLIYKYNNNELILYLNRTGSHADLFD